ncbi:MAG: hypothetical protein EOO89_32235 [Pedobacter sp.]|nr:MAG: hypothetical protein EOO89_32235 [Pedobacter sp.]
MRILRLHIVWLIVPVLWLASGCFHFPDPDYKAKLIKIPAFLRDHFPNKLPYAGTSQFVTNTDTTSQCIYYFLLLYGDNADTTNSYQRVLAAYHAADTNLISIKRETITYWNPEKKKYYTDEIRGNKYYYPVPYFDHSLGDDVQDIYSDETPSGLSKDFIIYVFDFKAGNYWQGLKPLDYLPGGWENGYSKGTAINKNKNIRIYWFVVW